MPPPPSKRRSSSRLGNTDASSDVGSEASTASASSSRSKRKLPLNDEQQRPPRPPFSRDVSVASWAAVAGSSSALSLCTPVNPASPYDAPLPRCIWCFHLLASHAEQSDGPTEDKCLRRLFPAKSRWEAVVARTPWLATARATRAAAEQQQQAGPRPRGHQQTGRSKALQAAYCAEYKRWWSQEGYALQTAARLALASFNTALLLPLAASAASGEFSDYEMLKLEFVSRLRHHVKPALFAPGGNWGSLNSSANQVFSGRLRAVEPFSAGVASARMPGERCANDFAMLSERYEHVASYRNVFAALLSRCNNVEVVDTTIACNVCGSHRFDSHPRTSVEVHGSPALIALELPDAPSETLQKSYDFRAADSQDLNIGGRSYGTYRLVSVLYHKRGTHFIADAYNSPLGSWFRYDCYPPASGTGRHALPPVGRIRHTDGLAGTYYAMELLYAREGAPPAEAEADMAMEVEVEVEVEVEDDASEEGALASGSDGIDLDSLLAGTKERQAAIEERTRREAAADVARAKQAAKEAAEEDIMQQIRTATLAFEAGQQQKIAAAAPPAITCPDCGISGAMRCVATDPQGKNHMCSRVFYGNALCYGDPKCFELINVGHAHYQCISPLHDDPEGVVCLCMTCGRAAAEEEGL